jgi:hypothetical protein
VIRESRTRWRRLNARPVGEGTLGTGLMVAALTFAIVPFRPVQRDHGSPNECSLINPYATFPPKLGDQA